MRNLTTDEVAALVRRKAYELQEDCVKAQLYAKKEEPHD